MVELLFTILVIAGFLTVLASLIKYAQYVNLEGEEPVSYSTWVKSKLTARIKKLVDKA